MRMHELLLQARVPAQYARILEDHFLGNEVLGKSSHGIVRLPAVLRTIGEVGAVGSPEQIKRQGQSQTYDAHDLPGVVALTLAAEAAIKTLDESQDSLAAIGVGNYEGNSGVLGRYAFQMASAGYIGVVMASSYALVAPPGGREPVIGTNPIAIAIPTVGTPLVVDVSTAATAYGKVLISKARGEELDDGLVIDAYGNPSTDPDDADNGAMLALGDHKGFGLGLAVELIAGGLVGADLATVRRNDRNDGAFLLAIRPSSFTNTKFLEQVTELCATIVHSSPRAGSDGVRLPGERYALLTDQSNWPDTVEIPDSVWESFTNV